MTAAYVVPSKGSLDLVLSFGAAQEIVFRAPLTVENSKFHASRTEKSFDLLFSSRFVAVKNPAFFLEVASLTAELIGRKVSCLLLGDGPLLAQSEQFARTLTGISYHFAGFLQQDQLPAFFSKAKVFLFPTSWDPWGVVVNEAFAAGLPVITSVHAGAAGELVLDGINGFVLPLEAAKWAKITADLLTKESRRLPLAENAQKSVQDYSFSAAATGYTNAIRYCIT
jgi:glycosyltransferase involved in cell wall biosynthesis